MTATNADQQLVAYKDRIIRLEIERRDRIQDIKEVVAEMKSNGRSKEDIAGVKLAVRRSFESEDQKAARVTAEEVAESLGEFVDLPLGRAAVEAAV